MTAFVANVWSFILSLCLFTLLPACGSDADVTEAPSNLIEREVFIDVLVEMNLIEAMKGVNVRNDKVEAALPEEYYQGTWDNHDIDAAQFKASFEFYRHDVAGMSSIYEEVAKRIKRMEDENHSEQREAKSGQDENN